MGKLARFNIKCFAQSYPILAWNHKKLLLLFAFPRRRFGTWAHWSSLFEPLKNSNFKALKNYKKICEHSQLYTLRSWKFII
jgi:hypothetical protein